MSNKSQKSYRFFLSWRHNEFMLISTVLAVYFLSRRRCRHRSKKIHRTEQQRQEQSLFLIWIRLLLLCSLEFWLVNVFRRNLFEFLFNKVNSFYERIFSAIGESIGQRPIIFLLFSLLLTGICSLGFLRLKIINDVDQLFIPTDSQSIRDREKVAELLPLDFDDYYLHQDFDLGRYGEVIFIPDDSGNIDRPKVREEIERIYNLIEKINITYQNRTYFYGDLCAKRSGKCVVEGDIFFRDSFWQVLREKTLDKFMIGQVYNDADSGPNFLPFIFGSEMKLDFKAGTLDSRVIKFRFNLRRDQSLEKLSQLWEAAFLEFFNHFRSVIVKHFYSISTSIDKELENNINLGLSYFFHIEP